jgi:phosphate-selective porin OprO/OprP
MIQRTCDVGGGKRAACTSGLQAWAVALGFASGFADQGLAQVPANPAPTDPPRAVAATPVDAGLFPLPEIIPLQAGQAIPSSPQTGTTSGDKKSPDDAPLLDGAGNVKITAPSTSSRRSPLEASWEDGLWFESSDKQFRIHVGGNGQWDSNWLIGPHSVFALPGGGTNGTENDSATFLRRVRLRLNGDIYERFDYMVEYDFANADNDNSGQQQATFGNLNGAPAPINVWMQVRDVPVLGNVRIGHQLKPIGMTNNTYQGFLPFMERPQVADAFYAPFDKGFATGITAQDTTESERVTWRYGVFRPLTNVFGVALNKYLVGSRVTGLPVYEDDGARLVHVGFGSTYGDLVEDELRSRARPLLRNGPGYAVPVLVDTGEIPGSRQYQLAPEFAAVNGSWTLQAEWAGQFLTDAVAPVGGSQGTVFYHGGYVELLYFLTGEYQSYDKKEGVFSRVVPNRNFSAKKGDGCTGCGAWQIGARFDYLDLNDKAIQGGTTYTCTAGLNWYWNPNMKMQFNYILEHRDQPGVTPGWINGLGMRAAYDF